MSATDCRLVNIYRTPVYQKRVMNSDNYTSIPHARSSSPNPTPLAPGRRHSTPPANAVRFVEVKSPQSNPVIKHYYPNIRSTRVLREHNSTSDSVKSLTRPVSLVTRRHQEERVVRITTPTSVSSITDIILPIAKKNRSTILDTPSPSVPQIQFNKRSITIKNRDKAYSLDLERNGFLSNEDSYDMSLKNDNSNRKSLKWFHKKCSCQFFHCDFCQWRYHCPICCWITCLLLALGLVIGIFILTIVLSN